jgi:hypothetical protein
LDQFFPMNKVDDKLFSKLLKIKEIESKNEYKFDISKGIDITLGPENKGASFPYYEFTPYFRLLNKKELLKELEYPLINIENFKF